MSKNFAVSVLNAVHRQRPQVPLPAALRR